MMEGILQLAYIRMAEITHDAHFPRHADAHIDKPCPKGLWGDNLDSHPFACRETHPFAHRAVAASPKFMRDFIVEIQFAAVVLS